MSYLKKILITLPDQLLEEVDSIIASQKINRSEFVREAMRLYIREKKRLELREKLKRGYQEMAGLNLTLAEMHVNADSQTLLCYEEKLAECE
ncbi:MAG: ribbon-helix-helix protein, CopG family [Hyphomonadaceae bacterium]|nr:ribbon-helix-helix protein, CopG family [Clostridia bacterium]